MWGRVCIDIQFMSTSLNVLDCFHAINIWLSFPYFFFLNVFVCNSTNWPFIELTIIVYTRHFQNDNQMYSGLVFLCSLSMGVATTIFMVIRSFERLVKSWSVQWSNPNRLINLQIQVKDGIKKKSKFFRTIWIEPNIKRRRENRIYFEEREKHFPS